ncbi:hypothetical protein PY98_04045, partial [Lacticaseibacillus rhamnosus]
MLYNVTRYLFTLKTLEASNYEKKTISTTIATGLLLAPMALGLVANQAPAATVHAATSTIAKTPSNNALANWTANTPSHIKQQIQSQGIDPSNAKAA